MSELTGMIGQLVYLKTIAKGRTTRITVCECTSQTAHLKSCPASTSTSAPQSEGNTLAIISLVPGKATNFITYGLRFFVLLLLSMLERSEALDSNWFILSRS